MDGKQVNNSKKETALAVSFFTFRIFSVLVQGDPDWEKCQSVFYTRGKKRNTHESHCFRKLPKYSPPLGLDFLQEEGV